MEFIIEPISVDLLQGIVDIAGKKIWDRCDQCVSYCPAKIGCPEECGVKETCAA